MGSFFHMTKCNLVAFLCYSLCHKKYIMCYVIFCIIYNHMYIVKFSIFPPTDKQLPAFEFLGNNLLLAAIKTQGAESPMMLVGGLQLRISDTTIPRFQVHFHRSRSLSSYPPLSSPSSFLHQYTTAATSCPPPSPLI